MKELAVGQEIPPLVKEPITRIQLVQYAGASGDFNTIHVIEEEARAKGLNGVIAHGMLSMGFLGQLLTDWIGQNGDLLQLQVRFRSQVFPGDVVTCRGIIRSIAERDNGAEIDLEIWEENQKQTKVITGIAKVWVPHT